MPETSLDHPYGDLHGGCWYKGSLHVHSNKVCVDWAKPRDRAEVLADYRCHGHAFVMFAEQNCYTTHAEIDGEQLNGSGVLVIPGAELDGKFVQSGHHVSHVNPADDCHVTAPCALDEILRHAEADRGALVVLLHPADPGFSETGDWDGLRAMEVVSGWYLQRPHAQHSPFAFNAWDSLLGRGVRVWGLAGDCSFDPEDVNVAWLEVFAPECSVEAIVQAVREGRFYATTGVRIERIAVDDLTVTIETADAARIYAVVDGAERQLVANGPTVTYEVPAHATYVRFECVGADDTWADDYETPWTKSHVLHRAWTQPFWTRRSRHASVPPNALRTRPRR